MCLLVLGIGCCIAFFIETKNSCYIFYWFSFGLSTTRLTTTTTREMIDIYEERGMKRADATVVVETMAKYEQFFIDVMMKEELELQVPEANHTLGSFKEGVIMFFSFALFGSFPLLGYIIIPISFPDLGPESLFISACVVTGLVLFFMGCLKSFIG